MGSKKMRTALAAAIGAERLAPGASASSAFNLGNLLSGMPYGKREQVKQQLRLRSLPRPTARRFERVEHEAVSPRREWERAELFGWRGRGGWKRAVRPHSHAREPARSWEPAMPDRLAANGWQQALTPPQASRQAPSALHAAKPSHPALRTKFVFDEFAPGVLPGTSVHAMHPAAAKRPAPPPPAAVQPAQKLASKHVMSAKEAVDKATGFGDNIVKVKESPEDKLKKEVQHLRAMNAAEKLEFEKREKVMVVMQ